MRDKKGRFTKKEAKPVYPDIFIVLEGRSIHNNSQKARLYIAFRSLWLCDFYKGITPFRYTKSTNFLCDDTLSHDWGRISAANYEGYRSSPFTIEDVKGKSAIMEALSVIKEVEKAVEAAQTTVIYPSTIVKPKVKE